MRAFGIALVSLALGGTLAGCGVDPDAVPPGEEAPVEPAPATLDLEAAGIIIPPQNGFEQLEIPFGSSRLGTETTLGNVLGEGREAHDGSGDCWLTQIAYDGLTVNFDGENAFVGYYATVPFVPELTRAEMLADPQVALVEDSTIGEEFAISGLAGTAIAGVFSGAGDDARVEALWAGENCIAR